MGLAELLLGKQNPFAQWANQNTGALGALGAGLASGPDIASGLATGLQYMPAAKQNDLLRAEKQKAEALQVSQTNATKDWLAQNRPDLLPALDMGIPPAKLYEMAIQPQGKQPIEINGQLVDPVTFEVIGDFRTPEKNSGPAAPSGYTWNEQGGLSPIPGGPADPATTAANKPLTDADVRAGKLSAVVEADKKLLLGDGTTPGVFDALADPASQFLGTEIGVGGVGVGKPGMAFTSPDFQSATNALTNIAQSYLYAISGQAAPAGEVAKIVDSVTPKFGESEQSVKQKKQRLESYIAAVQASKYAMPAGSGGASGNGWTVIGVEQ